MLKFKSRRGDNEESFEAFSIIFQHTNARALTLAIVTINDKCLIRISDIYRGRSHVHGVHNFKRRKLCQILYVYI